MVILCSTALTSILSGLRYVCEQTCKVTSFSYIAFLFFQLDVTTCFLQDTFFVISRFLPKIILLCQAVQFAFISTRRRQRYSTVSQILQLANLSSPRKGLKPIFFSLIAMVITVEMRGVCKTSLYFLILAFCFDSSRSPACTQLLERRRTVPVWRL